MTLPFDPALLLQIGIFAIVFVVAIAMGAEYLGIGQNRKRQSRPYAKRTAPDAPLTAVRSFDPAEQLRAVMAANFRCKKVISGTEAKVMAPAEAAISEANLRLRVMAQVALGEVLASDDDTAFYAVNAKRVDLLIMSERRDALAVIEYQGQGHYQGAAPTRDAIKKEALRKAGVRYTEITHEHGPDDVRREISRLAWCVSNDPKVTMRKVTGA